MKSKFVFILGVVASASGQLVDDFSCPDEFVGFYPHLISCDKYWHCQEGIAELKTCGNGLGFLDTDDTFTLEQCAELHLVECGERTEIEPPISTRHCPRLYGTYADDEDCGIFWVCQDGKANRYECPPGLAYDKQTRGCRWADQVAECSSPVITVDEEGSEFQCPRQTAPGIFTKHAHPADCRQYFLCIAGTPREYGCPLGTVFNTGSGTGIDGECTDPEEVPECKDYYGDLKFNPSQLTRNGFNSGRQDNPERVRSGAGRIGEANTIQRTPSKVSSSVREKSRPAPPALQAIVDTGRDSANANRGRPARPQAPSRTQTRPQPVQEEGSGEAEPTLPPRLTPVRIQSFVPTQEPKTTQQTQRPSRLEIITDRPNFRTSFRRPEPSTTVAPTSPSSRFATAGGGSRFSTANRFAFGGNRFQPTQAPTTTSTTTTTTTTTTPTPKPSGLPDPVKAAPGPNGEEYYYYYYYYDDEDEAEANES